MCDTALPLALPLPYTATANTALLEHPGVDVLQASFTLFFKIYCHKSSKIVKKINLIMIVIYN